MKKIIAFLLAVFSFFGSFTGGIKDAFNVRASFEISPDEEGALLGNISSCMTVWSLEGNPFVNMTVNEDYNVFEFVRYIEVMQCTGGSAGRDLFKNPLDFSVTDDYDFTQLTDNCAGILALGAKPYLKLGSVPLKYTENAVAGADFGTNLYPPDDYDIYYDYIAAVARELVEKFGRDEVLTWRFSVMTEFENADWFKAQSGNPEESCEAYCKLYDYTAQALVDEIGSDVFVGAHAMAVTEGLWDERDFIKHCALGTNYKTGKKGSPLRFLTASYYDTAPGKYTSGMNPVETINHLRKAAEEYGFDNLVYAFDEGRILSSSRGSESDALLSRTVGQTYQAGYDARMAKMLFENGIEYFSAWEYLSDSFADGNPTVSYYVARLASFFEGSRTAKTKRVKNALAFGTEAQAFSAFNSSTDTLRVMAYNFKNSLSYSRKANLNFKINAPQFDGRDVKITAYVIDDNCNWFDEWEQDRKTYGIGSDCFSWSPDDPVIGSTATLSNPAARELYFGELKEKYARCSVLTPIETTAKVGNSTLELSITLEPNAVVFYEITPVN